MFNNTKHISYIGTITSGDQFISDVEKLKAIRVQIKNLMCVEFVLNIVSH